MTYPRFQLTRGSCSDIDRCNRICIFSQHVLYIEFEQFDSSDFVILTRHETRLFFICSLHNVESTLGHAHHLHCRLYTLLYLIRVRQFCYVVRFIVCYCHVTCVETSVTNSLMNTRQWCNEIS